MAMGSSFLNEKFVRKSSICNLVIYCHRNLSPKIVEAGSFFLIDFRFSVHNQISGLRHQNIFSHWKENKPDWMGRIVDDFISFNGMMDRNKLRSMLVHCFGLWMVNQNLQRFQGFRIDSSVTRLNEWKNIFWTPLGHIFNKLMDFVRLIWIFSHTRPPCFIILEELLPMTQILPQTLRVLGKLYFIPSTVRWVTVSGRRLCFANN